MKIGKIFIEKKYQIKGESNRIPPYSYNHFCKELSKVINLNSMTMSQRLKNKNANTKRVLLRHDIDHDPWTAEKMAVIESDFNLRATYFVLHTAPYFKHKFKKTMEICRNIQSLGHEIGLHNDLITDYFINNIDPDENLSSLLTLFNNEGINILGSASHGSPFIQKLNDTIDVDIYFPYANYLVFSEIMDERLRNLPDKKKPPNPKIKSKKLSLPCINMNEFGLKYESYFVLFDYYISDTGRRFWSTGEDPLMTVKNLQNSITVQCLFHPTWWKYYLD